MNLPINFRDPADVIAEEAARFRALSPAAQIRAIMECIRIGEMERAASGRKVELDRLDEEEKRLERQAIKDFIARHHNQIVVGAVSDPTHGSDRRI